MKEKPHILYLLSPYTIPGMYTQGVICSQRLTESWMGIMVDDTKGLPQISVDQLKALRSLDPQLWAHLCPKCPPLPVR